MAVVRQLLERHQNAKARSHDRQAFQRRYKDLLAGHARQTREFRSGETRTTTQLPGHRGAFHCSPRRLLLFVRLVRPLLPRNKEHVPNDGGTRARSYRTLRRCRWKENERGRRKAVAERKSEMARPWWRIDSASKRW